MLKVENPESRKAAEDLGQMVLKTMSNGQVIDYKFIESNTGLTRTSPLWQGFLKKFRRTIRKARGWCLEPINGVGYRIMHDGDVVTVQMARRAKKQVRQGTMAKNELTSVSDKKLDTLHRALKYRTLDSLRITRNKAMMTRRLLAASGPKKDPNRHK